MKPLFARIRAPENPEKRPPGVPDFWKFLAGNSGIYNFFWELFSSSRGGKFCYKFIDL